jgi:hypothetical protein
LESRSSAESACKSNASKLVGNLDNIAAENGADVLSTLFGANHPAGGLQAEIAAERSSSAGGRTGTEIGGGRTLDGTIGSSLRPDGKCRNTVNPRDDGHRKRRSGPLGAVRPLWAQMELPPDSTASKQQMR